MTTESAIVRDTPDSTGRRVGGTCARCKHPGDDHSATWNTYVERLLSIIELDWLQYPPWGCFAAEDESGLVRFLLSERQTTAYGLPPGA